MMTKLLSMIFFIAINTFSYSQKVFGDFNNDNINDTLYYKCYNVGDIEGITEPTCNIKIVLGKENRIYNYNINYISHVTISSCGAGCISVYDSSKDTEYSQEYLYCSRYNNWILTKDETYDRTRDEIVQENLPEDYFLSIDNKKYRKKNDISQKSKQK